MKRSQVLNALKLVIGAVDDKQGVVQGSDSFVFSDDFVNTYNNKCSFSYPLETGISCTVKARETLAIIEKMKGDNITFELKKDYLQVSDGSTKLKMKLIKDDEDIRTIISDLNLDDLEWKKLPKDFADGVDLCAWTVCRDKRLENIQSMLFTSNEIWSSDNYRISRFELDDAIPDEFTLPSESVFILQKLSSPPEEYATEGNWVHFKSSNGIVFSSNLAYEKFPVEEFSETVESYSDEECEMYEFPEGIEKAIDVASILAFEDKEVEVPSISISRKGKKLIVEGKKACGSVSDEITFSGKMFDEGLVITVPPGFLKTILGVTREFAIFDKKIIQFKTDNFVQLVTSFGDDGEDVDES